MKLKLVDNDTQIATVTPEQIANAEQAYTENQQALEALERLNAHYEEYDTFDIVRPDYAPKIGCERCLLYLSKCYCNYGLL